jgi:SAM-dependent methyltransferase
VYPSGGGRGADSVAAMAAHHDVVRREFERQADGFGHRGSFFAAASTAAWIDDGARLAEDDIVLDAGGGAGDLSRALAARARQFVVADLTGALRDVGRDAAEREGVGNVLFVRAELEDLPFPDRSFDAVLCRFVVHHLADPAPALAELARVCRRDGRVVLADLVVVDDDVADRHNALERLRDPSHTTALTADGLAAALAATGLVVSERDTADRAMDLEPWIERAHTPAADAERIRAAMEAEIAGGGPPTGLRPARGEDGVVRIEQRWVRLVARHG